MTEPKPGAPGEDAVRLDGRPVVCLFRSPVFNASEGFLQTGAALLERYQPLVLGLERKGGLRPELEGRVLILPRRHALALKLTGRFAAPPAALGQAHPVLVHAHFATDGLTALPIARALGVPLVTTLHGYDASVRPARMLASGRLSWMRYALLRRRLQREGALFLPVSDALRGLALAQGFPPDRTITHRLGVQLDLFAGPPEPTPAPSVLHVGRLVEKKGTAILIEAFAEVRRSRPDAELVIIGDGPLEAPLRRLAAGLGLGDAVRFLGARPHAEVRAWMKRAWVLAAPSVRAADGDAEGLPTVIMEAAASGLPVIGSDHSGIPEAIEEGASGFLAPEHDAALLAARLALVLGSAELRARLGGRALALAGERFNAVRQAQRLEGLYDQLVGARVVAGRDQAERACA